MMKSVGMGRLPLAAYDNYLRFVELIDGAGHWVQLEQPAKTNAQVLRFPSVL